MIKFNLKKILLNTAIILIIFLTDRISKIYILKLAELNNQVDIYISSYLNLYLIWNKGMAFGLFSYDDRFIYNLISFIIFTLIVIILFMTIKAKSFQRYSLIFVLGGSLGNFFDRVYFSAVPDFIDFHINDFHWFIFNVADIFISIGIFCLIYIEMFFNRGKNEKVD